MTASGLSGCHREFVWDAPTGACCRAHLQLSEEPNSVLQVSTAGAKRVHDRVLPPRERGSSRAPIPTVPSYLVGGRLNQNSAVPLTTGTRRPGPYTFHQALCVTPGSLKAIGHRRTLWRDTPHAVTWVRLLRGFLLPPAAGAAITAQLAWRTGGWPIDVPFNVSAAPVPPEAWESLAYHVSGDMPPAAVGGFPWSRSLRHTRRAVVKHT